MSNTLQGERYLWLLPEYDQDSVLKIASSYNLSIPICQALFMRGISTTEKVASFLFSSYEKDVAHPSLMKDSLKSVERILQAIKNEEKILVFGDYDVDGITSSSMMMICLPELGAKVNFFLPNRARDGYGLSTKIVRRAAENGYKLIITVDNGITAFEQAKEAKNLGIDLIITDHHRQHESVPDAFAIVNPNQLDCLYPFKHLAGVGVTFKLLSLLYEKLNRKLPAKVYELLLLGTIADVVPLLGENRFWVRHGLHYVNKVESFSFKVLKQNGKFSKPKIGSLDIGFTIAPQINALGRLEDPRQGVKFLIGSDIKEVEHVGAILLELNQARREIERTIFLEIDSKIKSNHIDLSKEKIIIAASDSWSTGVIGLVASRLVSEYGLPTLLFHLTKDGMAKGSCRSINSFNIFDALHESKDLLEKFGGHSQAAGLSLKVENLPILKNRLEELISSKLTDLDLKQKLNLEAEVKLMDLTGKFLSDLEHLEPFGHKNERPYFYIKDVVLVQKPQLLKDVHVKCHIFADGVIKPVIFFNSLDLFEKFSSIGEESFDLAAQVTENYWNGRTNVELLGLDVCFK